MKDLRDNFYGVKAKDPRYTPMSIYEAKTHIVVPTKGGRREVARTLRRLARQIEIGSATVEDVFEIQKAS